MLDLVGRKWNATRRERFVHRSHLTLSKVTHADPASVAQVCSGHRFATTPQQLRWSLGAAYAHATYTRYMHTPTRYIHAYTLHTRPHATYTPTRIRYASVFGARVHCN